MVSYQKYPTFSPSVCSVWDKWYRYGFNGMEKNNEISGNGNSYTTEFRQLDVRLGRWFSRDPIDKSWSSTIFGGDENDKTSDPSNYNLENPKSDNNFVISKKFS
jgi:hypothetical protein